MLKQNISAYYSDDDEYNDADRASPDPDFAGEDCSKFEKLPIPDEFLWKMFSTGVSFRALSTILKCAFFTADVSGRFNVSASYLFNNYKRLLQMKEIVHKDRIHAENEYGTLCFDHQSTRKLTGKYEGTSHRLAIVWYSNETHNVIGMPEMRDKTAGSQLQAIRDTCDEMGVKNEQIVALSCDNENTNVGYRGGTCVLLERYLQKSLLRVMCRHHILELVIKNVYDLLFGAGTPRNIFHDILQKDWSLLRSRDFPLNPFDEKMFMDELDFELHQPFKELRERALNDLRAHSKNKHIRDDYREVTLLALKFFGELQDTTKGNQVKFRTLINPSHARFMASIIQGIECYLFRRSIDWTEREELKSNIKRFAHFSAIIYIRFWNRSAILFDAPTNDIYLLKELQIYKSFDRPVAMAAMNAFNRHLNYMGEELAPLTLFSEKSSNEHKNLIASKLLSTERSDMPLRDDRVYNHLAYHTGREDENFDWSSISVTDLIGKRSNFFFDVMNLPRNFLRLDASQWSKDREYKRAKNVIQKSLICVNDGSERVISNCKSKFSKQRCRKEDSFRQNMLNLYLDATRNN